jgi:DNA replication protein DnaC
MSFVPCSNCKNGYIYRTVADETTAFRCSCYTKYIETETKKMVVNKSHLPLSILDYDITQYIGPDKNKKLNRIQKFITQFESLKSNSLYFYSENNSTQKTTLASYMGREIAVAGYSVFFLLMDELLVILQEDRFKEDKLERRRKFLLNVDLLIIDDCFDEKKVVLYKSGYQFPFLDEFLRKRMETLCKSIIFTSNVKIDEITKHGFPVSIQNLVKRKISQDAYMTFEDSVWLKDDFDTRNIFS